MQIYADIQRWIHTARQRVRQTYKSTERLAGRQRGRERDREIEREKHTNKQREREDEIEEQLVCLHVCLKYVCLISTYGFRDRHTDRQTASRTEIQAGRHKTDGRSYTNIRTYRATDNRCDRKRDEKRP